MRGVSPPNEANFKVDPFDRFKVKKPPKARMPTNESKPRSSLSKYKSGGAPKDQYSKYFTTTENVFYDDSPLEKTISKANFRIPILALLSLVLICSFALMGLIKPYSGYCPQHATCRVFIRCHYGYDLDGDECVVSQSLIDVAHGLSLQTVNSLKLVYGGQDCGDSKEQTIPSSTVSEMLLDRPPQDVLILTQAILNYLRNADNQLDPYGNRIYPTAKSHSFRCWFQISFRETSFKAKLALLIIGVILGVYWIVAFKKHKKAARIYVFLSRQVLQSGEINVSAIMPELKDRFGDINGEMWQMVEDQRQAKKEIICVECQELFWKSLKN